MSSCVTSDSFWPIHCYLPSDGRLILHWGRRGPKGGEKSRMTHLRVPGEQKTGRRSRRKTFGSNHVRVLNELNKVISGWWIGAFCFTIPITYCFVTPFKAPCIIKRMSVLDNKPLFQCVKFTLGEIKVLWTSTLYNKSDSDHDNSFSGSYKTRLYSMNSKDIKFFFENKRSRFCYQIKQPKSLVSEIDFLLYNIVQTVSLFGWYHEV